MCKWGTTTVVNVDNHPYKNRLGTPGWIKHFGGIPVDSCIAKEIQHLLDNDVITLGCCCGHNKEIKNNICISTRPTCLVHINSKKLLNKLGYKVYKYNNERCPGEHTKAGIYQIFLKGSKFRGASRDA